MSNSSFESLPDNINWRLLVMSQTKCDFPSSEPHTNSDLLLQMCILGMSLTVDDLALDIDQLMHEQPGH